jgi:hypothetical protein
MSEYLDDAFDALLVSISYEPRTPECGPKCVRYGTPFEPLLQPLVGKVVVPEDLENLFVLSAGSEFGAIDSSTCI